MPPKKDMDDYVISELGNWNVAARFSHVKIMIPMEKCEYYEDMAKFGYETVFDELLNYEAIPDEIVKIVGLQRLNEELIKLASNAKFAMKKSGTKQTLEEYQKKLKVISTFIPSTYQTKFSQIHKTKSTHIIPSRFEFIRNKILGIKEDMNDPLNKNHLIFTDKEEFNPHAFKERLKHRIVNKG